MDFSQFTQKAKELSSQLGQKAREVTKTALESGVKSLQNSSFVIKSGSEFDDLVASSANKTSPSGKVYEKKALLLIGDPKTDFFKKALYVLPVIYAKAWSQNTLIKLMSSDINNVDFSKYGLIVSQIPSCVVFGDKKVVKIIAGEKNINTLVNSLSLDILSTIEKL